MARKKKSISQNVVDVATTGMPQPVKKILGGRLIALLIVVCVPILFATGILSVRWENGRPKFSVNRQRAAEVKQEAVERIEKVKGRAPKVSIPSQLGGQSTEPMRERAEDLKQKLDEKLEQGWSLSPKSGR